MILRRITEHVKAQNWFAVFLDFIIVVIGVVIGIQVANWNEARIEQRAAKTYIERIREDLRDNERDLARRIEYYAQVKAHALAALASFEKPQGELGEQFLIDAYQASNIISRSIDRSTFDEVLSVGAMNSIPNLAVRRRLANFYANAAAIETLMQYVPPYRESLRRRMPYPVQAAMVARCYDIATVDSHGAPTASLPERCELGLPPEDVAGSVAAIFDPELELDLTRRLADLDTKLANYRRLIDRARSLDEFLAEAEF